MQILKNYGYNLSYQILTIILPIITTPYITRIFNSEELGRYGYFYSIITYFILFSTLGIANYGTKEISANQKEISNTFWNIYIIQLCSSFLSIFLYFLACTFISGLHDKIALILIFLLFSKIFDISWLFQGIEDFKHITIRNILVKVIGVLFIFSFIKSKKDLLLYIFFLVFFEFMGQLSMWVPARKIIGKPRFSSKKIKLYVRPIVVLFLPQIAISLYVTVDRTMLGILSTVDDVGIYDQAIKIINILLTLVTSLGSVMLPRVSRYISEGDKSSTIRMHNFSFLIYNIIIFPLIFGFLIINKNFVEIFLGKDFYSAWVSLTIMIFRVFFIGWTNIMGIQILVAHSKNKEFMISTTIPAIFSIGLNIMLIPKLGFIGASITSLVTEILVWIIQIHFTKTYLKELNIISNFTKILISSLTMCFILYFLKNSVTINSNLMMIILLVTTGVFIYIIMLFLTKVADLRNINVMVSKYLIKKEEIK